ncbi:sulfite exporter TauE/SafE family protein [Alteromonas pelagimontana]|uniref:Probable membrane transporter protein n=1 Tax=Alteromonas pelagimontana TaxID=1858656 RepID=A0A6M4MCL6_9ALTE|nr:sulfite exporter TauE/SafE family protein [Alteromonas pelagimontana]QJR80400.1 sulfite exporter TauE/SafE family protein [Alteromonas pelagimontana]
MDPVYIIIVCCAAIGLVAGLLAGMLGIGGGLIIVPALSFLMVHFLNLSTNLVMPMAVATSLSTIVLTSLSSARAHHALGNINRHIVVWCGVGVAVGATLGAQIASTISGHTLKNIFSVLVIVIAAQMVLGKRQPSAHKATRGILVTVASLTGAISALMGIGGGALLVPALVWFQVNIRQAIGCAALSGLVIALFGTASFVYAGRVAPGLPVGAVGYVYLPATFGIVATSIFTANLGAKLGQRMNTDILKKILAGLLVLVSIRMILGIE